MKTNTALLESLMDLLTDEMKEQLEQGKSVYDKATGETIRVSPDAATLNVIRQFLKDAGIDVRGENNDKLQHIRSQLPFGNVPADEPVYRN